MPYLQFLYCEQCGPPSNLEIDHQGTIEAYIKEGRKEAFVNQATMIWDYLIYNCNTCRAKFKYTFRDVERSVRKYFSSFSEEYREYFEKLDKLPPEQRPFISITKEERIKDRYSSKE